MAKNPAKRSSTSSRTSTSKRSGKTAATTGATTGAKAGAKTGAERKPGTVRLRLKRSVSRGGRVYGPGEADVPSKLAKSLILNGAKEV